MHNEMALQSGGFWATLLELFRYFTLLRHCWEWEGVGSREGTVKVPRVNYCEFQLHLLPGFKELKK